LQHFVGDYCGTYSNGARNFHGITFSFKDNEGAPTILLQIFSLLGLLYGFLAFCFVHTLQCIGEILTLTKPTFSNNAFCKTNCLLVVIGESFVRASPAVVLRST
jgi:hypothetical protein